MSLPQVFVTRHIAEEALAMLKKEAKVLVWEEDSPIPRQVLLKRVKGVDGLLCLLTERIDKDLLDVTPGLRAISNMAVGYDNVEVAEVTKRGIPVGYTPDVLTQTCADFAFALLLAAARRIAEADRFVREGRWKSWSPTMLLGQDIHEATLGIVGLGRIGLEVAKRARGFDMRVAYFSRTRRWYEEERYSLEFIPELHILLANADFVSLHVPLTSETRHLIGEKELASMRPTAILINTTRGPVVDQKALYHALRNKTIAGAAIDVAEVEPIPPDDPLLRLDNLLITPHIASASGATRRKMAVMAAGNLLAGLKGKPMPHCVNPEVYKPES